MKKSQSAHSRLRSWRLWIRTGKIKDAKSIAGILYYSKFVAQVREDATRSKRKKR